MNNTKLIITDKDTKKATCISCHWEMKQHSGDVYFCSYPDCSRVGLLTVMVVEEIVSGTIGTTITAINPNDYSVIKRDDFIRQYGKAAERLLREERQQLIDEVMDKLEAIRRDGKIEYYEILTDEDRDNVSLDEVMESAERYNQAIDDITKLLVKMK